MRHPKAFTLVELLVVIAITALLASLLLPVMSQAREQALRLHCAANLRQMGVSTLTYASEFKGAFPNTYYYSGIGGNATPNGSSNLIHSQEASAMGLFMDHAGGDARLLACPSAFGRDGYASWIPSWSVRLKSWQRTKNNDFYTTTGFFSQIGMQFGYSRYVGTDVMFTGTTNAPVDNPRYSDGLRGYKSMSALESATMFRRRVSTNQLGTIGATTLDFQTSYADTVPAVKPRMSPTNLVLWGERITDDINGWDHVSHMNPASDVSPTYLVNTRMNTSFRFVSGMNEVMYDGHAQWFNTDQLYAIRGPQFSYHILVQTNGKDK